MSVTHSPAPERRHHLGQRRRCSRPGRCTCVATGWCRPADRCGRWNAAGRRRRRPAGPSASEELAIVGTPTCSNMPTETMRSKRPVSLAIVAQMEADAIARPAGRRPSAATACAARWMSVTPVTSTPDAGRDRARGRPSRSRCRAPGAAGDRAAACRRCGVSCSPARSPDCRFGGEIGAANTARSRVEEEIVELVREIVVMGDVAAGAADRIVLL